MELEKKDNNTSDFEHYIGILENHGINDARKKMSDMYLVDFYNDNYKFFTSRTMTLNDLLKYIQIKEYDLNKLSGIVEDLDEVLNEYSDVIDLSETRYEKTIQGFKYRVEWLEKYKEKDSSSSKDDDMDM